MSKLKKKKSIKLSELLPDNQDYIEKICTLIDAVRSTLLASGLKQTAIAFRKSKLHKATLESLKDCYLWLVGFQGGCCKEYAATLALVPKQVWDMYAMTGMKGSYEQNRLRLIKTETKKQWANRPEILKRVGTSGHK